MRTSILLGVTLLSVIGCKNTADSLANNMGTSTGSLPTFERNDFNQQKLVFLSKLEQFNRAKSLSVDVSMFVTCDLTLARVQELSGYGALEKTYNKPSEDTASKSLASKVTQAASTESGIDMGSKSISWLDGKVLATPDDCNKLAQSGFEDSSDIVARYYIKRTYSDIFRYLGQEQTSTNDIESYVERYGAITKSEVHFKMVQKSGNTAPKLVESYNYQYSNGAESVNFSESNVLSGLYLVTTSHELDGNRTITYTYWGDALAGVNRMKNGQFHGLNVAYQKGQKISETCFKDGEVVQFTNCDFF